MFLQQGTMLYLAFSRTSPIGDKTKDVTMSLPKIVSPVKTSSFADIIASVKGDGVPAPKLGRAVVVPMSDKQVAKICPELVSGLLRPDGTPWEGSTAYHEDGKTGRPGATYVIRPFLRVGKSLATYILQKFGAANRLRTASKQKAYTAAMNYGIGGDSGAKGWNYVGNTAIFTMDEVGSLVSVDMEQHNLGHTCNAVLDCDEANATILVTMIFGIPGELRDNIDKNVSRSPKDIASTRTALRERFFPGAVIGGSVKLTDAMAKACIGEVSQVVRIVKSIREGGQPKDSGSGDIDSNVLDLYTEAVGQAIEKVYALDSSLSYTSVKDGKETIKKSGGLRKRYAVNHLVSIMVLTAGFKRPDGSIGLDDELSNNILCQYKTLGDEKDTDKSDPMVVLRMQIDKWKDSKMHSGTDGKNVVWSCLKVSLMLALAGEKIKNPNWLVNADNKLGGKETLSGMGLHHFDVMLGETADIVCGIDDYEYIDPAAAAMAEAGQEETDDETPSELLDDDDMGESEESLEE
jgi:hypothetical protein